MADRAPIQYKIIDCYELQLIDCNCNNCFYMQRDLEKYKKWEDWHRAIDLKNFEREKNKAIFDAEEVIKNATNDHLKRSGEGMLKKANKMTFQFNKIGLINYGHCTKFDKPVSFIPLTCQIETQKCFVHRKDLI